MGPDTAPRSSRRSRSPAEISSQPSGSALGAAERMFSTPAVAFLPNSAPCGPRSTSKRSRSTRSEIIMPGRPRYTPSRNTPTLDSSASFAGLRPRPRMATLACRGLRMSVPTLGTRRRMSCTRTSPPRCSSAPLIWLSEIGTSCAFSERLRALTTTSSRPSPAPAGSATSPARIAAKSGPLARATHPDRAPGEPEPRPMFVLGRIVAHSGAAQDCSSDFVVSARGAHREHLFQVRLGGVRIRLRQPEHRPLAFLARKRLFFGNLDQRLGRALAGEPRKCEHGLLADVFLRILADRLLEDPFRFNFGAPDQAQ